MNTTTGEVITTFEDFYTGTMKNGEISEKYVTSRKRWLNEHKSKSEAVIDKIPTDELPECEQIDSEHCKVGDFIRKETFEDKYDDEKEEILGGLKDGDILAYCWNDITTWWKRRKNNDGDGLVRIK